MLEEVEMPPRLPGRVVHGAVGRLAVGAREPAARLEVDLDVEPLLRRVEVGGGHEPRRVDAEGKLEELGVAHVGARVGLILAPSLPPCQPALKDKPSARKCKARP